MIVFVQVKKASNYQSRFNFEHKVRLAPCIHCALVKKKACRHSEDRRKRTWSGIRKPWSREWGQTRRVWREICELLATYSCYRVPCYYGARDLATRGRASHRRVPSRSLSGRRWVSCRRRPGKLLPEAEKPTYVCYLAKFTDQKQSFGPKCSQYI